MIMFSILPKILSTPFAVNFDSCIFIIITQISHLIVYNHIQLYWKIMGEKESLWSKAFSSQHKHTQEEVLDILFVAK